MQKETKVAEGYEAAFWELVTSLSGAERVDECKTHFDPPRDSESWGTARLLACGKPASVPIRKRDLASRFSVDGPFVRVDKEEAKESTRLSPRLTSSGKLTSSRRLV